MAFIDMDLYRDLYNDMSKSEAENVKRTVQVERIKKDLEKRKKGRKIRIVFLWIALITLVVGTLGILLIGGGTAEGGGTVVEMPDGSVVENVSQPTYSSNFWPSFLKFLEGWFYVVTWAMCWVGFPIGWNWTKKERGDAKNQLYVSHTIYDDGTVETSTSKLIPRIGAFIASLFVACLTFCFSLPIAVVQVFWSMPADIDYIEFLLEKVEKRPDLFFPVSE